MQIKKFACSEHTSAWSAICMKVEVGKGKQRIQLMQAKMVNKNKIIKLLTRATIRQFLHYSRTQELNKKMAFSKEQIDIFNAVKIYISTFKKKTK